MRAFLSSLSTLAVAAVALCFGGASYASDVEQRTDAQFVQLTGVPEYATPGGEGMSERHHAEAFLKTCTLKKKACDLAQKSVCEVSYNNCIQCAKSFLRGDPAAKSGACSRLMTTGIPF